MNEKKIYVFKVENSTGEAISMRDEDQELLTTDYLNNRAKFKNDEFIEQISNLIVKYFSALESKTIPNKKYRIHFIFDQENLINTCAVYTKADKENDDKTTEHGHGYFQEINTIEYVQPLSNKEKNLFYRALLLVKPRC